MSSVRGAVQEEDDERTMGRMVSISEDDSSIGGSPVHQVPHGRRPRGHCMTEALEENELLAARVRMLEDENEHLIEIQHENEHLHDFQSETEHFYERTQMDFQTKTLQDRNTQTDEGLFAKMNLGRFRGVVREVMYKLRITKLKTCLELHIKDKETLRSQLITTKASWTEAETTRQAQEKIINTMKHDIEVGRMQLTKLEEQTNALTAEREAFRTEITTLQEALDEKFASMDDMNLANDLKFGPRFTMVSRPSLVISRPSVLGMSTVEEEEDEEEGNIQVENKATPIENRATIVKKTDCELSARVEELECEVNSLQADLNDSRRSEEKWRDAAQTLECEVSSLQANLNDSHCSEQKWRDAAQNSLWSTFIGCSTCRGKKHEQGTPMEGKSVKPKIDSMPSS